MQDSYMEEYGARDKRTSDLLHGVSLGSWGRWLKKRHPRVAIAFHAERPINVTGLFVAEGLFTRHSRSLRTRQISSPSSSYLAGSVSFIICWIAA